MTFTAIVPKTDGGIMPCDDIIDDLQLSVCIMPYVSIWHICR